MTCTGKYFILPLFIIIITSMFTSTAVLQASPIGYNGGGGGRLWKIPPHCIGIHGRRVLFLGRKHNGTFAFIDLVYNIRNAL